MAVVDTVDAYLNATYKDASRAAGAGLSRPGAHDSEIANRKGASGAAAQANASSASEVPAKVMRITLQIGKRSSYIPSYISEIWPFAVKETSLDGAILETEDIEGKDFLIKEIEIEE
jgi:hypothetical protein